jgi:RimJ/RimL family protein N-acetyltransferase
MARMKLVSVYSDDVAEFHRNALFLYDLLKERDPSINISHREIPPFFRHIAFIQSHPYAAWYLAQVDGESVGSVYITEDDEIGIFLVNGKQRQGLGTQMMSLLMQAHPRDRYIANISPSNEASQRFFVGQGFRHIQNTYEMRHE